MITAIEDGPWMSTGGFTVENPAYGALGHVFMGMQERWNSGKCSFPAAQAVEWTTRVIAAGGMYTWTVPRSQSSIPEGQFKLLLKIDAAVKKSPGPPVMAPIIPPSGVSTSPEDRSFADEMEGRSPAPLDAWQPGAVIGLTVGKCYVLPEDFRYERLKKSRLAVFFNSEEDAIQAEYRKLP